MGRVLRPAFHVGGGGGAAARNRVPGMTKPQRKLTAADVLAKFKELGGRGKLPEPEMVAEIVEYLNHGPKPWGMFEGIGKPPAGPKLPKTNFNRFREGL